MIASLTNGSGPIWWRSRGVTNKILYRGAEAEIRLSKYMDKKVVQKQRVKKPYRIKEIDRQLDFVQDERRSKVDRRSTEPWGISSPLV